MNVKQIIKDNNLTTVYSIVHGRFIPSDCLFVIELYDGGESEEGGECLIFPSKEERNWDRFKPQEPTYKQCESVEQFADLFLGAKVKHKTQNRIDIIMHVSEMSMSVLFHNFTLLDGTPLGIKCDE